MVEISPLLREILRRSMRLRTLDRRIAAERHLLDVLVDEATLLPQVPLDLPMPRDARGARAAALIRAEPAARNTLAEVARAAAASARTLERLFRDETGLPFGLWRQRARRSAPCSCWRKAAPSPAPRTRSATRARAPSSPPSGARSARRPAATSSGPPPNPRTRTRTRAPFPASRSGRGAGDERASRVRGAAARPCHQPSKPCTQGVL